MSWLNCNCVFCVCTRDFLPLIPTQNLTSLQHRTTHSPDDDAASDAASQQQSSEGLMSDTSSEADHHGPHRKLSPIGTMFTSTLTRDQAAFPPTLPSFPSCEIPAYTARQSDSESNGSSTLPHNDGSRKKKPILSLSLKRKRRNKTPPTNANANTNIASTDSVPANDENATAVAMRAAFTTAAAHATGTTPHDTQGVLSEGTRTVSETECSVPAADATPLEGSVPAADATPLEEAHEQAPCLWGAMSQFQFQFQFFLPRFLLMRQFPFPGVLPQCKHGHVLQMLFKLT